MTARFPCGIPTHEPLAGAPPAPRSDCRSLGGVAENVRIGLCNPRGADQHLGGQAACVCDPSSEIRRSSVITVMVSQNPRRDKRPRLLIDVCGRRGRQPARLRGHRDKSMPCGRLKDLLRAKRDAHHPLCQVHICYSNRWLLILTFSHEFRHPTRVYRGDPLVRPTLLKIPKGGGNGQAKQPSIVCARFYRCASTVLPQGRGPGAHDDG
jgi:hypothetical protein